MSGAREDSFEAMTRGRRWVPLRGMRGSGLRQSARAVDASVHGTVPPRPAGGRVFEWIVIGGGIHGTYLSHFLKESAACPDESIIVIDPYAEALHGWRHKTANTGMDHLRSAAVHHIDLPSLSLKRFSKRRLDRAEPTESDSNAGSGAACGPAAGPSAASPREVRGYGGFLAPYGRPLLSLFNRHAEDVVRRNSLGRIRLCGRATAVERTAGGFSVTYDRERGAERLAAKRVILSIGNNDETSWPDWARGLREGGARVHHVLDQDFDRRKLTPWRRAVVYGGGLSGVQIALALAAVHPGSVTLLSSHEIGVHLFDSDPGWQGGNLMHSFAAEPDPARRRRIISHARYRGSITPEAQRDLERACAEGSLRFRQVDSVRSRIQRETEGRDAGIVLSTNGGEVRCNLLILATGYDSRRPGGEWLDKVIRDLDLPCAPCGFPIVGPSLEWIPGLYVSGPLADLELGPVSRNIAGAHRAAARIEYFLPGFNARHAAAPTSG